MDHSRPRQSDHLGVNKIGKNIRKSPLHQPNFGNGNAVRPQPQPQVYNISKNDFRSIVQQLTGSPSRESLPQPPQNPLKPQNTRLQKIRPAPLTQFNRPPVPSPAAMAPLPPAQFRPPPQPYAQPLPQAMQPMMGHGDPAWSNTAESPVSVYMRYLQSSLAESGPNGNHVQPGMPAQSQPPGQTGHPQLQHHAPGQSQMHPPQFGSVPYPAMPAQPMPPNLPSPRFNGPVPVMPALPSPRFNGPPQPMHGLPSPQFNGPGLLPSPTSQFLLPSPTAYPSLFSPRSPYPLLSPGVQYPPPLTPTFMFSPMGQPGVLGPGPGPQPPPSPGLMFPLSPSGFFPISSPRWRDR
ncbi:PREDICTED: protein HAIKU1-like [Tarenaya hassleriana]|uniref:protein HAIKU1-like n=1 Tax=Tarenaya hassleriana TaxID=28532 RepID=UPI00053CA7FF|nr:PREDICTED: protein HAIKU1-like [Tarenaya hassleriana]XP_010531707.1 PREDICTED: protein HAIKU1-like [Tarenaya hassleriana]XP_019057453.1 PREDICTED: protein HAIKU1-like [Tarenaya hassleriana]